MNDSQNQHESNHADSQSGIVKVHIIDLLGSLVPGIAFLIAVVPAFMIPIGAVALTFLSGAATVIPNLPKFTGGSQASLNTILFLLFPFLMGFFVFAYVAGHFFFRQNPKIADEASFRRISQARKNDGRTDREEEVDGNGMMVRDLNKTGDTQPQDTIKPSARGGMLKHFLEIMRHRIFQFIPTLKRKSQTLPKQEKLKPLMLVEFPYHFLKQYLVERGIEYLAQRIPWDDDTKYKRRAKHFANALKLRIQAVSAEASAILAKNEAHVRLSSSMWYVCRALIWLSTIGSVSFALGSIFAPQLQANVIILFPFFALLSSYCAMLAIEDVLHYQREREILFILEIAHWLVITERAPKLFDGLSNAQTQPPGTLQFF